MVSAGIDVGSLWTKVIILNEGQVKASSVRPTGMHMLATAEDAFRDACTKAGLSPKDITKVVGTGYGRVIIPWATKSVTEITCHARGINHLRDSVRTLIDIGGQDSKVIRVDERGKVVDFVMNDKCAAGTGRFVEVMAKAAGVSLEEIGRLALKSTGKVHVSSICTIFAESEVISLVSKGVPIQDIVAGIFHSIIERVYGLARRVGVESECAIAGGLGKNPGIIKAWEEQTGIALWVPQEPQMVGALGAALIAAGL